MKRFFPFLVLLAAAACQPAVTATPTALPATATSTVIPSPTRTQTATTAPTATATLTATELPPVYVPAICTLVGRPVRSDFPAGHAAIVVWGWSAATQKQVEEYIRVSSVVVTFDGVEIKGTQQGGISHDESSKLYVAAWVSNLGIPKLGIHTITYLLTFSSKIFDGFDYYGPGTDKEKQEDKCEIDVK